MNREYHRWYSERVERDMELLIFGHAGAKVLVFPTRDGRFYEYENLQLVDSIRDKLEAGHLQLYCLDSFDHESLYCFWRHPADRIRRHMQFEDYVLNEVLPLMAAKNGHPCTIAHGCSLGAYHAVNIAFRHPHLFQKVCALSGRYDLTLDVKRFSNLFDGYYEDNVYYHTPSHFLPNLDDPERLAHLRAMDIVLVIGDEDPFLHNNRELSRILTGKGISHSLTIWSGRAHRGSAWRAMVPLYL
jgi:esterase/lipase superfamily enzyme